MSKHQSLTVEWWATDRPRPYAGNPRVITDDAVAKVATSIKEFGWRQPIVVDAECVIVIGHVRHRAAIYLGLSFVPVHVVQGLDEDQIRALRLADNRTGEETRWDAGKLDIELKHLGSRGFEPLKIGFDPIELPTAVPAFAPVAAEEVRPLDKMIEVDCPKCGHRFERRAR